MCELLVLPSRYEGMPNVLLEAMACSKAVAATAVEGILELLGDQASQQTSAAANKEAWFSLVERLLADEPARKALGQSNRSRIAQHFNLQERLLAYEKLLINCGRSAANASHS